MKRVFAPLLAALLFTSIACAKQSESPKPAEPRVAAPSATVHIERITATRTPTPTPPPPQLCLVTRQRGVSPGYVPADLMAVPPGQAVSRSQVLMRKDALDALLRMFDAAREEGHILLALSGYRSYEDQVEVLRQEIRAFGEAQARRQVAEPGHSEHQLGDAMDVTIPRKPYALDQGFGGEPEGQWLATNAARFGFVISYPLGKEHITGYIYEPWHIRYVGTPLAERIVASGLTLTEYLPQHGMAGCPGA
jgi:zinc D-Ala-D-Ala carboxypeptidase